MKNAPLLASEPYIQVYPPLVRAIGLCGAMLVQQIHWWCEHDGKNKDGHKWVWGSSEFWASNLGGFGATTIRKVLKELVNQGILHSDTYNKHSYDRTLWFRVNYEILAKVMGPKWQFLPHASGKICRMEPADIAAPIPDITFKENTEITSEQSLAKEQPMKADEILAGLKAKEKHKPVKVSVSTLQLLWKQRLGLKKDYVKNWTAAERGQARHLINAVGEDAYACMDFALQSWPKFIEEVKLSKGEKNWPSEPLLGWMLKYHDVLMQLIAEKPKTVHATPQALTKTTPAYKKSDDNLAQTPHNAPEPHVPATLEDVLETQELLKSIYQSQAKP